MIKTVNEFKNFFLKPPNTVFKEYAFTHENVKYIVKLYVNIKKSFNEFIDILVEKPETLGNSYLHIQISLKDIKTMLVKQYYVSNIDDSRVFVNYAFIIDSRDLNVLLKRKYFDLLNTELNVIILKQIVLKIIETAFKYVSKKVNSFF